MKLKLISLFMTAALLISEQPTDETVDPAEIFVDSFFEAMSEYIDEYYNPPILFSEREMDDFVFEGQCSERRDGKQIHYRGEISDRDICEDIWEIICMQEDMEVLEGGNSGIGSDLILTDRTTNDKFYIGYDIWYEKPDHEGGPLCFVVTNDWGTSVYYKALTDTDEITFVSDTFKNLIIEGVKTPENIISDDPIEIETVPETRPTDPPQTEPSYKPYFPFDMPQPVLLYTTTHYVWGGSYAEATLIDSEGRKYSFQMHKYQEYINKFKDTGRALTYLYENNMLEKTGNANPKAVQKCQELARNIDRTADYIKIEPSTGVISSVLDDITRKMNIKADYDSFYVFNENTSRLILLDTGGEDSRYLNDPYARIIRNHFGTEIGTYETDILLVPVIGDIALEHELSGNGGLFMSIGTVMLFHRIRILLDVPMPLPITIPIYNLVKHLLLSAL